MQGTILLVACLKRLLEQGEETRVSSKFKGEYA